MLNLEDIPIRFSAAAIKLSEHIDFEKIVPKGGNGLVLIGKNRLLDRDVAVKFYYWGGGDHAEPALLAGLECDQILKIYHAEKINDEDAFFMTPFCAKGDLDDAMENKKFGTLESLDIILQVAAGVSYMHGRHFLHRDLKLSNVFLLADNRFVIGDFGSVVQQDANGCALTLTRHSLIYRPPEEISSKIMRKESDIYQLGIVLFQLLGGYFPYEEYNWLNSAQRSSYAAMDAANAQFYASDVIEAKIVKGKLLDFSSLPAWVPQSMKSFVRKACAKNYADRFATVADMTAKLNNIRHAIPEWRVDNHPTLIKSRKSYRIVEGAGHFAIEKNVGSGWRAERRFAPSTIKEAVQIAETL